MLLAVLFFNDETGDIGAVNARFSVAAFNGGSVSAVFAVNSNTCLLYTSPSPRD